jgi:hypothetical protein
MARPQELGPDSSKRRICLNLRRLGLYKETIADLLEIDSKTIRNTEDRDDDFAEQMEDAKGEAVLFGLGKLLDNVRKGQQRAIEYYLDRILKLHQKSIVELQGRVEGTVVVLPEKGSFDRKEPDGDQSAAGQTGDVPSEPG